MALNTPNTGEKILPWAREATREINSLKPTAGNGISITKTNSGTTYSLSKDVVPYADSAPPVIAGELSAKEGEELPEGAFATTYSLEKNEQNAFSLFGFSKIEPLSDAYHYSLDELSNHVDFVLRDTTSANTVLSCPTVRYDNVLCLLVNAVSESDDDGDNPVRDALSVVPDSEIREPVTYSIQHNEKNEGELELYKFHDGSYQVSSTIDVLLENNDEVLIRQRREDESGNLVRRLAYLDLKKILSGGGEGWPLDGEEEDIGRSLNLNSNDEAQIYGFQDGTPVANNLNNRMFVMRRGTTIPRVEYLQLSTLVASISADIPTQGYTGDVKYVLSSTYSTSTNKFTNKIATMHFENGLLKWNDTTYLENQEVFTAVEEEL